MREEDISWEVQNSIVRHQCERLERRRLLASTGTLLSYDFSTAAAWSSMFATTLGSGSASATSGGYGTIDVEGGATPSSAVRLSATPAASGAWTSDLNSGRLAVTNTETDLGKLTLSFKLSVSQTQPVTVRIFSYDATKGVATGGLETTIYPAATNYNQRFDVDLSTMKPLGSGTFNPKSSYVAFDFGIGSPNGWSAGQTAQVNIDNVNYAKPAYYVSASGKDTNNGRTEATIFANPARAVSSAQPGDIIDVMTGTYAVTSSGLNSITFSQGGTPAAWLVLKNFPGRSPVITNEWWNAIKIGNGAPGGGAAEPVTGGTTPTNANKITYKNNVYFGGNTPALSADAYKSATSPPTRSSSPRRSTRPSLISVCIRPARRSTWA